MNIDVVGSGCDRILLEKGKVKTDLMDHKIPMAGPGDDEVKQAVAEVSGQDLQKRVKGKVRELWGADPNDLPLPGDLPDDWELSPADMPHPLSVEVNEEFETLPKGTLCKIDRLARTSNHSTFLLTLRINECEAHVQFSMSDLALVVLKHDRAQEAIIHEILTRSVKMVTDLIRKGLQKDLLHLVQNRDQDHDWLGLFPFGRE